MTWNLVMQSFAVLRRDKKLIVFPILTAIATILIAIPSLWMVSGATFWRPEVFHWAGAASWVGTFMWYFVTSFVVIFFNCALAACAQIRFSGGEPTISDGLQQAGRHADTILLWAALNSTVGMLIRAVEERVGLLGRIGLALFGAAWSIATYLIVPVLVLEDHGVIDSVKRSAHLLKKTWGEQLVAGIQFLWISILLLIPAVILGVLMLPLGILYLAVMAAVISATRQIFVVALYRFALTGEAPDGYSADTLNGAFRPR